MGEGWGKLEGGEGGMFWLIDEVPYKLYMLSSFHEQDYKILSYDKPNGCFLVSGQSISEK